MKKAIVAAIVVAFFVSTAAEARGGRGFSGGRSFSRPAPARTYAPKSTTVVKKNTTVVNQTVHQNTTSSSGRRLLVDRHGGRRRLDGWQWPSTT